MPLAAMSLELQALRQEMHAVVADVTALRLEVAELRRANQTGCIEAVPDGDACVIRRADSTTEFIIIRGDEQPSSPTPPQD